MGSKATPARDRRSRKTASRAYRALVKTPIEYAVGAVKALGQQTTVAQALVAGNRRRDGGALGQMGQVPFEPPNVAGWPGGASWLNSSTLFARLNFLNTLTAGGSRPAVFLAGPPAIAPPTAGLKRHRNPCLLISGQRSRP